MDHTSSERSGTRLVHRVRRDTRHPHRPRTRTSAQRGPQAPAHQREAARLPGAEHSTQGRPHGTMDLGPQTAISGAGTDVPTGQPGQ
eukprot:7440566-Heterocapsa_arctica.AAC.1